MAIHDDRRDLDPEQPMSLEDVVLLGTRLQRMREFDQARKLYQAVLEVAPEHFDALHFLGVLEHQCRRDELAFGYMVRALRLHPELPGIHQNLGNILLEMRRFEDAMEAYERCAELGGQTAELLNNIGTMRRLQGDFAASHACYLEALKLDPDCIDSFNGFGRLLATMGRPKEAMAQWANALEREAKNPVARTYLGLLLASIGRAEDAAKLYRDWLALEPENPIARHNLAACTGALLARASDDYVVTTFDSFAASFDSKLEALQYRAPEHVGEALRKSLGTPAASLDILDAGCGTGLCQPLLRPFARKLVGVDLSPGMLDKAQQRGGYDALARAELTEFIQGQAASFDVIASADTLCYFGELGEVSAAAYRALRPGGWFFFTVEALEPKAEGKSVGDVKLQPHGRFCHARQHLQAALVGAGFAEPKIEDCSLRMEAGDPVTGYVVSASRA